MKWSACDVALVPPCVVTVMSTVPVTPEGARAMIAPCTRANRALCPPNCTESAPARFVPEMTTIDVAWP